VDELLLAGPVPLVVRRLQQVGHQLGQVLQGRVGVGHVGSSEWATQAAAGEEGQMRVSTAGSPFSSWQPSVRRCKWKLL